MDNKHVGKITIRSKEDLDQRSIVCDVGGVPSL